MRTFLVAATGLPVILPTTALVAVVCFRLLALARLTDAGGAHRCRAPGPRRRAAASGRSHGSAAYRLDRHPPARAAVAPAPPG